ncbi:MAG: hypothetical protein EOP11_04640 [Proteobacteria bacterium]|nr:MAG: hypothetical protein EOP11_04640 [Pseudomonadota bacterium]
MERLSEEFRSKRNRLFWRLREKIGFRRDGYAERGDLDALSDPEAARLEAAYGLTELKLKISPAVYQKNLATLWILERMLGPVDLTPGVLEVLEPGCQDFARLPALRAYLNRRGANPRITGLEVDAFPLLAGFHSRADKARYYLSLSPNSPEDRYLPQDFFRWQGSADLALCFYPFVSANPALAWGLPKEFGAAKAWVQAFERSLNPGGKLLVVHQGEWEEEAFDEARIGARLTLLDRRPVDCPFYPLPHPACASLYRKD